MSSTPAGITPALRFNWLTPIYDYVVRYTTRERLFKSMLLDAVAIKPGESVLDVGCGTGTLLQAIADRESSVQLTGLDADPGILAIARRKLDAAGTHCDLVPGRSTDMAFPDGSFDRVLSTLFFHHLVSADKQATIAEIARVLKPGCSVHVADWGRPTGAHSTLGVLPDPTAGWICLNPRTRHKRADIAVSQRRIPRGGRDCMPAYGVWYVEIHPRGKLSLTIDQPSLKWPLMTATGSLPLLQALGPPISAPSPLCPAYSPVLRRRRRRDIVGGHFTGQLASPHIA